MSNWYHCEPNDSELAEPPVGKVTFYDPHPGIGGAVIPLPDHIKTTVDWLNGQTMVLDEAMEVFMNALDDVAVEEAVLQINDGWIGLKVGDWSNTPVHLWRLIRFRKAE